MSISSSNFQDDDDGDDDEDLISRLISRNVIHVASEIFSSLDGASLRRCLWVCQGWRAFLLNEDSWPVGGVDLRRDPVAFSLAVVPRKAYLGEFDPTGSGTTRHPRTFPECYSAQLEQMDLAELLSFRLNPTSSRGTPTLRTRDHFFYLKVKTETWKRRPRETADSRRRRRRRSQRDSFLSPASFTPSRWQHLYYRNFILPQPGMDSCLHIWSLDDHRDGRSVFSPVATFDYSDAMTAEPVFSEHRWLCRGSRALASVCLVSLFGVGDTRALFLVMVDLKARRTLWRTEVRFEHDEIFDHNVDADQMFFMGEGLCGLRASPGVGPLRALCKVFDSETGEALTTVQTLGLTYFTAERPPTSECFYHVGTLTSGRSRVGSVWQRLSEQFEPRPTGIYSECDLETGLHSVFHLSLPHRCLRPATRFRLRQDRAGRALAAHVVSRGPASSRDDVDGGRLEILLWDLRGGSGRECPIEPRVFVVISERCFAAGISADDESYFAFSPCSYGAGGGCRAEAITFNRHLALTTFVRAAADFDPPCYDDSPDEDENEEKYLSAIPSLFK